MIDVTRDRRIVSPLPARPVVLVLALALFLFGPALQAAVPAAAVIHPERWPAARSAGIVDPATEERITALLASMSLEEKVGQVIQADISKVEPRDLRRYPLGSVLAGGDSGPHANDRSRPVAWLELAREFRAVSTETRPGHVSIPVLFGIDAVHGHNNIVGAVLFPHNIGLGAARDPDLVRHIGAATAEQVAATGLDWTFAPTLAVPRDVRWGRSYEGYSEDPAVVRSYAAAIVAGLQGSADLAGKLQAGRIAATAKHFLADGGTHEGVDQGDSTASEDDLIRVHAQGYSAAIDAGVLTVMASYSSWRGQKMHGNGALLTDVLKGRMGFDGFVIGDWNAHGQVPGCANRHCTTAFNAGIDMFMAESGWRGLYAATLDSVRSGEIPIARLDDAVRRILRVKFRLGLFETARPYEGRFELLDSAAQRALAREAVRKSLVLLKNDGALPIRASARVLITGPAAHDLRVQTGGWTLTWQGTETVKADFPQAMSIEDGFRQAISAGGGIVVDSAEDIAVSKPEVGIVVFGEPPYAEMIGDIKLPLYNARAPLDQLRRLRRHGITTVAVFLSGRPLWVNPELNASSAFVAAWLPGTEGGGLADVLIGDSDGRPRTDFQGRLPFRWPRSAVAPPFARGNAASLFPVGYGLSYAHGGSVPELDEDITGQPAGRSPAPHTKAQR
jgi:beta-glucosidase